MPLGPVEKVSTGSLGQVRMYYQVPWPGGKDSTCSLGQVGIYPQHLWDMWEGSHRTPKSSDKAPTDSLGPVGWFS